MWTGEEERRFVGVFQTGSHHEAGYDLSSFFFGVEGGGVSVVKEGIFFGWGEGGDSSGHSLCGQTGA